MLGAAAVIALALLTTLAVSPADAGRGDGPVIYVTSQGLYYDSIVTADPLPMRGRFQLLETAHPMGPATEFGPGDRGYLGGRWWVDENGDGEMDSGDHFFSCPLLGPGREAP
jgi:hypothetical protein